MQGSVVDNNGGQTPGARLATLGQSYSPAMAAMRTAPSMPPVAMQGLGGNNRDMSGITAQGRQQGQSFNPYVNSGVHAGVGPSMNSVQAARMSTPSQADMQAAMARRSMGASMGNQGQGALAGYMMSGPNQPVQRPPQ